MRIEIQPVSGLIVGHLFSMLEAKHYSFPKRGFRVKPGNPTVDDDNALGVVTGLGLPVIYPAPEGLELNHAASMPGGHYSVGLISPALLRSRRSELWYNITRECTVFSSYGYRCALISESASLTLFAVRNIGTGASGICDCMFINLFRDTMQQRSQLLRCHVLQLRVNIQSTF